MKCVKVTMSKDFPAIAGDITAEALTAPSWLLRFRTSTHSLTAPFDGVCTLIQRSPTDCEVMGYISQTGPTGVDRRALQEIAKQLGFRRVRYERMDPSGNLRISHSTEVQESV